MVELGSDVDRIGFAIYRTVDGQCVDSSDGALIKEINVRMHLDSSPTLHLYDRRGRLVQKVTPRGPDSMVNVKSDGDSTELDNRIRRLSLDRQIYEQETAARREGNFVRFRPSEFDQAALHFIGLLRHDSDQVAPIYAADPYFMNHLLEDKVIRLYLDMFAATSGRPLCILCGPIGNGAAPWWSGRPCRATGVIPAERLAEERSRLRPLRITPEQMALRVPVHVGPTAEVHYDGRGYSMPPDAAGIPGTLCLYRDTVRIVAGRFEATHPRHVANGTVSRLPEHRAAHLAAISGARGKRYLKGQQLFETGEAAVQFLTELVHRKPRRWSTDVDSLHEFLQRFGAEPMERAFRAALQVDGISVDFVAQCLGSQQQLPPFASGPEEEKR